MESHHRKVLQSNRTTIIENIADPIAVNDLLYEKNLISESMRQEIEAESTKYGKSRKILDILPRRGPTAYDTFYVVMLECGNEHIADILYPERIGAHPFVGTAGQRGFAPVHNREFLPESWPNEQDMHRPVEVKPCNVRSELVLKNWNSNKVYTMKKGKRGKCVIISNQVFIGPIERDADGIVRCILDTRIGTEKDIQRLEALFSQLHFEVIIHKEKSKQELQQILQTTSGDRSLAQDECFVCVVCSHGTREGIYCYDGQILSLEDLTKYFDAANCQALQNKPKLFFIQACQGEEKDSASLNQQRLSENQGQELPNLMSAVNIRDAGRIDTPGEGQGDQQDAAPVNNTGQRVPTRLDFLIACATHPGYVSFRNTHFGSWFIQAVIHIFSKYACEESIQDMLNMVNELVGRGRTGVDDAMQAALFTSSLTKKFLFFPGIVADSEYNG